jgi:hypothetical protein
VVATDVVVVEEVVVVLGDEVVDDSVADVEVDADVVVVVAASSPSSSPIDASTQRAPKTSSATTTTPIPMIERSRRNAGFRRLLCLPRAMSPSGRPAKRIDAGPGHRGLPENGRPVPGSVPAMRRLHTWGWILFLASSVAFLAIGIRDEDVISVVAAALFAAGCVLFLLPERP